jgi:hypothetical protein
MIGFDSSHNALTINSGSLLYSPNIVYQFVIQTAYLNTVYSQTLTIQVSNSSTLPVATLQYLFVYFFFEKLRILKATL